MLPYILQTKISIPVISRALISRPRLIDSLNEGINSGSRLILVSAPAGFGKSSLVSQWLDGYFSPENSTITGCATWVALDANDNDPTRFLIYLVSALQQIDPVIGEDILSILQSNQALPIETSLTALINQLMGCLKPVVMVLDDYHLIANRTIHQAITFLIENLPPQTHLILISRADPPLPLSRFRARGQMMELRAADLRFRTEEILLFLNQITNLSFSKEQIRALESRTEGWIAGLQMAGLSLRDKTDVDEFIEDFSGTHRFILDYLTEEVLRGQPRDLQDFILKTAILKRLSGPLCETVTEQNSGQETLEKLEESNLFLIPLDDKRVWFRYHHLFADVMTNRLQRLYPDQISDLHVKAARWLQQHDLYDDAIDHALAADEPIYAAELVESRAMALLRAGNLPTLLGWFNKLSQDIIEERPVLSVFYAWVLLLIGRQDEVEHYLISAEDRLPQGSSRHTLRGDISAIRAYSAGRAGDFDKAKKEANRALDLLAEDDLSVRAVVKFVLGWVYYSQQDVLLALETLHQAGRLGEKSGNIHVAIQAWSAKAYILKRQGDHVESESIYKKALQIGMGRGGNPLPFTAILYSGLADLCLIRKDLERARQFAIIGLDLAKKWLNVDSQIGCLLTIAQIEHIEGNLSNAWTALEEAKHLAATHQITYGNQENIESVEARISESSSGDIDQTALPEPLTERELEVLQLLAEGMSNRAIATELIIALGTVKTHISRIMGKLGAENRTQAVILARELGLIS